MFDTHPAASAPDERMASICRLPAPAMAQRRTEIAALFGEALGCSESGSGVVLEFAGGDDAARKLLDFVLFERECCPSLTYRLQFDGDHSTIKLAIAGAENLYEWARHRIASAKPGPRLGCASGSCSAS